MLFFLGFSGLTEKHCKKNIVLFTKNTDQVISGKMTDQQAWKEHSHRIATDLAEKYGWEYRRVMPKCLL